MKQQCADAITAIGRKPSLTKFVILSNLSMMLRELFGLRTLNPGTVMPDSQVYAEAAKLAGQRAVHSIYKSASALRRMRLHGPTLLTN